ncbi:L-2-hydroxyglutarate oxidase [Endozoicomonas sp. 2B-B]
MIYDYCIIGGGLIGLATAKAVLESRKASICLIEKEERLATHQTGHNSGVVHAGIYYTPGSLKARLCRQGQVMTRDFCKKHKVPFEQCGKLIVATNPTEKQRLELLYQRAAANGIDLKHLTAAEIRAIEPNIRGTTALLSPKTAIVNYNELAIKIAKLLEKVGIDFILGQKVLSIIEKNDVVQVSTNSKSWSARKLVVCGGLQADRLARLAGIEIDFRIVPFRGEYFRLPASKNNIINHLIYPVPDPSLPFLGIHLTRTIEGGVTVGPNAVISFAREKYSRFSFDIRDLSSFITFSGFWKKIWKHRSNALHELKGSILKSAYLLECQKYCSVLSLSDLTSRHSGIRAQVITKNGEAVDDFLFLETNRMLHVCNAPSPAATSAMPIGKMIAQRII